MARQRRFRYGVNCQTVNWGDTFQFVPLGYHEVAPGESIDGTITANFFSKPVLRMALNRFYADAFVFYIPYRVLDENWPDFINGGSGTVPTVTNLFPFNYEKQFSFDAATPKNTAWLRRAYNKTWNEYFRLQNQTEAGIEDTTQLRMPMRPSTLETSFDFDQTAQNAANFATNMDSLRSAAAQDMFDRMRAFYGDRYVDYLRALGVEVGWAIQDVPELIGQAHTDWKFRPAGFSTDVNTPAATPGDLQGYFNSNVTVKVKRTFCPEHGLIAAYGGIREDLYRTDGNQYAVLEKQNLNDYWSPEFEMEKFKKWQNRTFDATAALDTESEFMTPFFEEYRKGENVQADISSIGNDVYGITTDSSENDQQYLTPSQFNTNPFFATEVSRLFETMQATTEWRLAKRSPVKPHGWQTPIY